MFYSIYFSPTGSTKKIASLLAAPWQCEKREIDLSCAEGEENHQGFGKADVCLVAVPSYGGRVPAIALDRMSRFSAEGTKAILLVTYGNREYDDTLLELKETLLAKGFRVGAAVTAVTEHSIIHEIAKGRPDKADIEQLHTYVRQIKERFDAGDITDDLKVKGTHPFREYGGVPLKPKAGRKCTSCGLCAKKCPVQAIPADDPKKTNQEICISCMRCIKICPEHARKLDPLMLKVAGAKLKKECIETKRNECMM